MSGRATGWAPPAFGQRLGRNGGGAAPRRAGLAPGRNAGRALRSLVVGAVALAAAAGGGAGQEREAEPGPDDVAAEWARLLASGPTGVVRVRESLREVGSGGEAALEALWDLLLEEGGPEARRGGVRLALLTGEAERGLELTEAAVEEAPAAERMRWRRAYVLEAERAGFPGPAARSALRIAGELAAGEDRRRWLALAGDLAWRAGDLDVARRALEQVLERAEPGTPAHRDVLARLFSVAAATPDGAERAGELYRSYVRTYPESRAASAHMAPVLARARLRAGDPAGAARVLEEAGRSADAPSPELERARGWLAFYRGRPGEARARLDAGVGTPGTGVEKRTEAIALLAALRGADSLEAAAVGTALAAALRGAPEGRAERLLGRLAEIPAGATRAGLLAVAAGEYGRLERRAEADLVRRRLVDRHPESPQVPGALLELARSAVTRGEVEAARGWLERLVVSHPESAVGPVARRLLSELEGRVPGS